MGVGVGVTSTRLPVCATLKVAALCTRALGAPKIEVFQLCLSTYVGQTTAGDSRKATTGCV